MAEIDHTAAPVAGNPARRPTKAFHGFASTAHAKMLKAIFHKPRGRTNVHAVALIELCAVGREGR